MPDGGSFLCARRHTFDRARQGYVNLLVKKQGGLYADRALFAARRGVFEAGLFGGMLDAVEAYLPAAGWLLDAGCGEGSALWRLARPGGRRGIGLDIAREAVRMAAARDRENAWLVGDICNLPVQDGTMDAAVNILTPANYAEFARVLRPGGVLVKAVPGGDHLQEVRRAIGKAPYESDLDAARRLFAGRFSLVKEARVRYAFPCGPELWEMVYRMTPLTAHAEGPRGDFGDVVTVDMVLLVGRRAQV